MAKKGKKLIKLSKIHADLWKIQSTYVKVRDKWTCVICGTQRLNDSFTLHASHYIHGNNYDFSEIVVNCNCRECHLLFAQEGPAGMKTKEAYRVYLEKKWGKETIDNLVQQKYQIMKRTRSDYEEIEKELKGKIALQMAGNFAD